MMQLDIMRLYLASMQELYNAAEQESLNKTGDEYEESLDQLAGLRYHMFYTRTMLEELEKQL